MAVSDHDATHISGPIAHHIPGRNSVLLAVEGLAPWKVREVWQLASPHPNHYVDITDVAERKIAALKCHVSQTPEMDVAEFVRTTFGAQARTAGLPEGRLAEAFHIFGTA